MGVNTMQINLLGRHAHLTVEPENLKVIQALEHKKWQLGTRRKFGFRPLLGDGIFTTDGAAWHHSREMLRPNFVRSQVGDLATFERHVSHLIQSIPKDNSTIDLSEKFFRLTMDSATEFLFGESTESLTTTSTEGFAESFNRGQEHIGNLARWGPLAMLLSSGKQWKHDRDFVHSFVDYYVEKGLAKRGELLSEKSNAEKPAGRYVFIDELVRQTTDRIRIRSELLNILLAGRDTTASLLTNVWWLLSTRPDIWERLQTEVAGLNGELPTFEQLKEMKYLKALLNESLRLHPVVPMNSREAVEDTTLPVGGGPDGAAPIFVKAGAVVGWSVYAMHRRKDYYGEDAEEFKPERWLDDPATGKRGLRPGWEYLPFNGGPRICLGQQFALTEASYTTTRLCQAFSAIESRDNQAWEEMLALTCVNRHGAKVALTGR
ncbi:putative P450 monooxygenase [Hortaea werneckii]|nr:putative P450 monooxygenase [Hortaea werneckii]KAI7225038.1 putative P450 monooxygenase [Hortaea werneckii]KAI7329728.1 putative P450 monooxygenase [Hortaea werneckii]KAI7395194.1 putative P450 monooxygenase [Hortaea werneckii]